MTAVTVEPGPALVDLSPPPEIKAVLKRSLGSVGIAVVAPAALFWATMVTLNVYAAVCAALMMMIVATGWRKASGRPVSRLLLLTMGILTIRTAFTLATGNTFVYFVQPVFADAIVAAIFLGSLLTTRPLVARLAPDFCPMNASLAGRPAVKRLFRRLTLLWGLVVVAKGTTTLWLLLSLSTADFVFVKSAAIIALTLSAVLVTVALSAVVVRREGLIN
jgi:intracellular septation protein A